MMFFFVVIAVGLMTSAAIFLEYGLILVVALAIGFFLPLMITGIIVQSLCSEEKNKCLNR
jgi:putative effector of murein hydrolase LrgA (UPF0299 family)